MFGRVEKRESSPSVFVAEKSIIGIPSPIAVAENLVDAKKQATYEEVAGSLGFEPAELTRIQLLRFFKDESIKLYDYDQAKAWLTQKRKEANKKNWCWRSLRAKDIILDYQWGEQDPDRTWKDGYYLGKEWQCRPYERLVPGHALEKVAKIVAKFGDKVKFFVSDYADPKVDPFIMVRPTMCDSGTNREYCLIFDMWNEPGFGD